MHSLPILINITAALVVAFIGGVIARKIGLPTIVGYLLAGIVIGPFTPGYVGDVATIQELAELGVIFLMFGVGLHFSFQDLWRVRDIAIPGALIQTAFATLVGFGLTRLWGWEPGAGIVLGLSISVASTVVLLRGLMDNNLLNTSHGQAAVGWLVMEDILSVLILVLMPALVGGEGGFDWASLALTLVKAVAFAGIMFFIGTRLIPWLLLRIANTRSRELFILAILAITLGTAMGAGELFGVSLALGAFVAGAIVSQSHLSHQVGADIFPFREAFSVLFFVSVGMLVNPGFLFANIGQVIALTLLIVIGKGIIVLAMGLVFPRPAKTFLVVAVGLSQIGEFSFILGSAGVRLNLLTPEQYSLILAGALFSITLNPLMFRAMPMLERSIRGASGLWKKLDSHKDLPLPPEETLKDHVVIIGYGRVGKNLAQVLEGLEVPYLLVESDMERLDEFTDSERTSAPVLFGDAANSEVITHAGLARARIAVITIPEEDASALIVSVIKSINPNLPIVSRASTEPGMQALAALGADHVVQPEMEGSLEMIFHTLIKIGYPLHDVFEYVESIRREHYTMSTTQSDNRSLRTLIQASENIQINWVILEEESPLIGKTLLEANIRHRTGASVVAIIREQHLIPNPKSLTVFEPGDRVGLIGEDDQIRETLQLVRGQEAPINQSTVNPDSLEAA